METNHILLRCITLLYRESQLENNYSSSVSLVQEVLETINGPSISVGLVDTEKDMVTGLKYICTKMCADGESAKYVIQDILQRVRSVTVNDESLLSTLKEGIESPLGDLDIANFCLSIRKELGQHLRDYKTIDLIKKTYKAMNKLEDGISITDLTATLYAELEPYTSSHKDVDPAIVGTFSIQDLCTSAQQFKDAKELNDERGILKTGWQGLNRMLGGGFRRGYEAVVGALQHNYKTGFTKQLFCQLPRFNEPYMIDEKRKPLMISISFEDPLALNMPFVYRILWENKYNEPAPFDKSAEEMAAFINAELGKNGYDVVFMHVNPTMWTYRDIQNIVLQYESLGYEIHCVLLDYLAMVPTTGCKVGGPIGSDMRDMFRRLRNFFSQKKITLITPHQLSTEAKILVRNGLEDTFVQEIANKGYYDGCKTIDQEVDLELYIHIVKFNSRSWLCIQRGKHRLPKPTPEEYNYFVMLFEDIGNLREDLNGEDTSRKKVGGNPIGSNKASPFWEPEA